MSRWTGRRSRPTPPSTRRCATSGWASGRRNWKPKSPSGWTPRRLRMRKRTPPSGATRAAKRCRPQVGDKKRRAEKIRAAKAELEAEARAAAEAERKARAEAEKKREAEGRKKPGKPAAPPSEDPDPKAQKNFTDPESRIMKTKDGFIQGYNAQAAVDAEAQVIVAHGLDANGSDQHQLTPMVDAVEANMGRKPLSAAQAIARAGVRADQAGPRLPSVPDARARQGRPRMGPRLPRPQHAQTRPRAESVYRRARNRLNPFRPPKPAKSASRAANTLQIAATPDTIWTGS